MSTPGSTKPPTPAHPRANGTPWGGAWKIFGAEYGGSPADGETNDWMRYFRAFGTIERDSPRTRRIAANLIDIMGSIEVVVVMTDDGNTVNHFAVRQIAAEGGPR